VSLQYATTVQQAKIIADVAAAQQVFASRQQLGYAVIGYAHEIKTYALAKLGELLHEMPKATGAIGRPGPGRGKRGADREPRFEQPPTLAELGVDKKTAAIAQQLAALAEPDRAAIAKRETPLRTLELRT